VSFTSIVDCKVHHNLLFPRRELHIRESGGHGEQISRRRREKDQQTCESKAMLYQRPSGRRGTVSNTSLSSLAIFDPRHDCCLAFQSLPAHADNVT